MLHPNYVAAFLFQAKVCKAMGAPFTGRVLEVLATDPRVGDALNPVLEASAALTSKDLLIGNHPMRVLASLHYMAISGLSEALREAYADRSDNELAATLETAIRANRTVFGSYMSGPPQTNEVRRSFCLAGGFLTVAQQFKLPLRCLELGASAGLNTIWDRYHYEFGAGAEWGDGKSPIHLAEKWVGSPPPVETETVVAERQACDLNPFDLTSKEGVLRLLSYIWPDQTERLVRTRAAIELAQQLGVRVERADAVEWLRTAGTPKSGFATVIYHSIFFQYLEAPQQAALSEMMKAFGEAATAEKPLAWLRLETAPDDAAQIELRLSTWPGDEDRILAKSDPHGTSVEWRGR